ncbi:type I restriction-modification system subunit M [Synechococcus elongatus]|uniref:site-specific DNA-methyltransferase (adenine-specific) n=2 Tax=Synechococcus elongatus TaxID=32046 RepID=Q31PC9_SYNE7|nr:class I SAM-dependent DNA methyltransferase [Synechococcus elongatus]ABB57090.1 type I restriction-modification [Synechococcus elongatus PCC 7942 = FACHB-805]AJD58393.1 restriction endonuclease subunit M [Synechococcus elongatus UTEX 2973]UOW70867.1 type I restriction enzyme M protein [Synechococcus elongatus PCC 7943]UOW73588.1 type I restriction enzyme M protein [Synechococcus elongatus PCC 6311]UOW76308.1 type I restriction enzyme M protein [Synechococcus elongatus PCC 6301]
MTFESSQSTTEISSLQAEFLGVLQALGGSAGNSKLQQLLAWDDARYESVKAELMLQGRIQSGRGRGGSVTLMDSQGIAIATPPDLPMAAPLEPQPTGRQNLSAFIWSVADLLRGDYKQSDYGKIILPFTVLRRLDCVLAPTKAAVLEEKVLRESQGLAPEPFLLKKAGQNFCNTSPLDLKQLMGDADNIGENLRAYIQGFTPAVRDIFDSFEFHLQIDRLEKAGLLYLVTERFAQIDLHPDTVSNAEMGLVFEELIRKFAELSNETAGEHFTPREVIRLMVNLLFIEDDAALTQPGIVRSLYDPTAGTGGMLSVAEEHLTELNPSARLVLSGQELNPESYAICKADMLIKGQNIQNICFGNTLSDDKLPDAKYDYMLSNPPFGVEWKKIQKEVQREAEQLGYSGRFGPGLPRVSDGSLLFLLHLISKMRPASEGGSRLGIVLNGSPLFTGGAGSGESEIRRYVLENDLVEAIIALPTDMFYNTGISTYIWILSNRKPASRKGKVQLIDASGFWQKMRKSLGSKRKELSEEQIAEITRLFGNFEEADRDGKPVSKIFRNEEFGYRTITVERPQRDEAGNVVLAQRGKTKGQPVADASLRDTENVPLTEDVDTYFQREVLPHVPDAWIDPEKTKVGYEIPFNRHFYVFTPPRSLEEIDAELQQVTDRILTMLGGLSH